MPTMRKSAFHAMWLGVLILLTTSSLWADTPMISGTIYHSRCNCTRSGDRVLLSRYVPPPQTRTEWYGPTFTNDEGVFSFYDVPSYGAGYVLHVYSGDREVSTTRISSPWSGSVTIQDDATR